MTEKKIIIAGGGLAGLVTAIHLTREGVSCQLIEKQTYPFHRVCGEYISNEVVSYLKSIDAYPEKLKPSSIKRLQLTSVNGRSATLPLDLGGFGVSRYQFDYFLSEKARECGVDILLNTEVESISFKEDHFIVVANQKEYEASLVIGSYGKRSKLDVRLNRPFIQKKSPYVGVKYHIHLNDFPKDLIALHNFKNGYCGISHVEDDRINLCYLTHRSNVKEHGSLSAMEKQVLFQNPFLEKIFRNATFLLDKPETINEISFETKGPVEDHILMAGDAAGMITPLCGNGMAIAIHSAKILSEHVIRFCRNDQCTRTHLEEDYARAWKKKFSHRLWAGRHIQRLFGDEWSSNLAVNLARFTPSVADYLIRKTHGTPF